MPQADCKIINLPLVQYVRDNLSLIEVGVQIPFELKLDYHLYDVPGGTTHAGHSHLELSPLIVAMSGSFDVTFDDCLGLITFQLNRSYRWLYIPQLTWRPVNNFSFGAVCMALASTFYKPSDYFHYYEAFRKTAHPFLAGG
jgi:hypothetical protein